MLYAPEFVRAAAPGAPEPRTDASARTTQTRRGRHECRPIDTGRRRSTLDPALMDQPGQRGGFHSAPYLLHRRGLEYYEALVPALLGSLSGGLLILTLGTLRLIANRGTPTR